MLNTLNRHLNSNRVIPPGFGKLVPMSAQLSVSEYCANFREFSLTTLIDTPLHVISTPCKILHLRERMCQYRHADRGQLQPNKESWEYYLNGSLRTFNVFVTTPQTTKMSLKVSQCLVSIRFHVENGYGLHLLILIANIYIRIRQTYGKERIKQ